MTITTLQLPKWYDLHTHLRQGDLLPPVIQAHLEMGCCGVLAMPNTKPPVAKVLKSDSLPYWSIEEYLEMLKTAGGDQFEDIIVPLYLTKDTTPKMIEEGAKTGLLRAVKYYPPHGTTGSDFSYPLLELLSAGVLEALEAHNIVLCLHGEEHGMRPENYLSRTGSAEEFFYQEHFPRLLDTFPNLRMVGEHLTTKRAVEAIQQGGDNVVATITPQHLLYTVGHLVQGLKYHLFCMPLVKFEEDRESLRQAVLDPENTKFFAGTDSAPHTVKATKCGCAAGCFTAGIAPQLYAEAFEEAGADLSDQKTQQAFQNFLCEIGPAFYHLKKPSETFSLVRTEQSVSILETKAGPLTPLPVGMGKQTLRWSIC